MKNIFYILLLHTAIFSHSPIFSEQMFDIETAYFLEDHKDKWMVEQKEERIYVNPEVIYFNENGIYLVFCDFAVPIENISSDNNGLYVNPCGIFGWWRCTNCGYLNSPDWNTCQNCQKPR